jgi:hypothetical protein
VYNVFLAQNISVASFDDGFPATLLLLDRNTKNSEDLHAYGGEGEAVASISTHGETTERVMGC